MKLVVVFACQVFYSISASQRKTTNDFKSRQLVTLLTVAVEWLLLLRNRKVLGSAPEAYYPA